MDENIRNALGNEVLVEILKLDGLPDGSEEKARAIEGVAKLYNLGLSENRQDNDTELQFAKLNNDIAIEERAKFERWFDLGTKAVTAAASLLTLYLSFRFMDMGFKFEQTGTYTSKTFQNLFGLFRPKLK